ncbi:ATP-dependent helicase [bacterium]|nr:MAG: ATP-dependent helicase [bacterium]
MASTRAMLAAVNATSNVELNPRQREAIAFRGGHLLLLAGPGTGKTETLARRAAALIDEARNAANEQPGILMLTFARKAARALRERVALYSRSGGRLPACSTFHAFALETLDRSRPQPLGAAGMLTPAKERLLIERVCRQAVAQQTVSTAYYTAQALTSAKFAADVSAFIARCKQGRVDAAGVLSAALAADDDDTRLALLELAGLFKAYEDEQRRLNLRDFRDLVNAAATALRAAPRRYAHVFVDELQDTDPAQLDLLGQLAEAGACITAVGDPNQSIYRFRDAAPAAIEDFRTRFDARTIVLEENHRCPPEILACANRLAQAAHDGEGGALAPESLTRSVTRQRGSVRWLRSLDPADEAATIAREIRRLAGGASPAADGHPLRYADFAVLLRETRGRAERIAFALRAHGIPVDCADAAETLGDPAVDFVLTYLRALGQPGDGELLARLLSSPVVNVRMRALRFARRALGAAFTDTAALSESAELDERERAGVREFSAAFGEHRARWRSLGARRLVRSIARAHHVAAAITAQHGQTAQTVSAHRLSALIELAGDVDAVCGDVPGAASQLAERASELFGLLAEAEGAPAGDGVHVLSMHAAKGLEFPVVFIAGAVRGTLPARGRPDPLLDEAAQGALFHAVGLPRPPDAVEQRAEELRLFYVACTRAAERLVLSGYAQEDGSELAPSPYLARIGVGEPDEAARATVLDEVERVLAVRRLRLSGEALNATVRGAAAQRVATIPQAFQPQPPATPALAPGVLSPSAIECYLRCPREFFFRYVVRSEGEVRASPSTLLGNVMHSALAAFHERYPSSAEAMAAGEAAYAAVLDGEVAQALERERRRTRSAALAEQHALLVALEARARSYARRYLNWMREQPPFVVCERELTVNFTITASDGRRHAMAGRIDRVDQTEAGLVVRDYKTGREHPFAPRFRRLVEEAELPPGGTLDGVLQLPLYAAALTQRDPHAKIAALDLLFLRGRAGENASFSRQAALAGGTRDGIAPDVLEAGLRRIADLCSDLYDGRAGYAPQPGNACGYCPFRAACARAAAEASPDGGSDGY